jgi:hypothetical protein
MSEMVSLSTLLSRMTRELRRVETRLTNLEDAISDILLDTPAPRSPRFHELQEIDRARQEVSGIADFLQHLADGASPECAVDARLASRSLGLADLAAALVHDKAVEAELGEFEHFV